MLSDTFHGFGLGYKQIRVMRGLWAWYIDSRDHARKRIVHANVLCFFWFVVSPQAFHSDTP